VNTNEINWSKVVEPQEGGYDVEVACTLPTSSGSSARPANVSGAVSRRALANLYLAMSGNTVLATYRTHAHVKRWRHSLH
jgi:hypothetical protein